VTTRDQILAALETQFRGVVRHAVGSLTDEQRARWFGLLAPCQRTLHTVLTIAVEELLGIGPAKPGPGSPAEGDGGPS
jgi:hypothetical protein